MSRPPEDRDREALREVAARARAALRDWTDATEHDPGVALLELLALLADELGTYADRAASGAEDDHVRVSRREDGSTVVEFGEGVHGHRPAGGDLVTVTYRAGSPTPAGSVLGVHRGVVVEAIDPMTERRLLVRVPSVLGDQAAWALACLPVGAADELPGVGDAVWVAFEGGDPSCPVWLGRPGKR